jgi:hypothetical protein
MATISVPHHDAMARSRNSMSSCMTIMAMDQRYKRTKASHARENI